MVYPCEDLKAKRRRGTSSTDNQSVVKSECLPVSPHCPPPPVLPKYFHPPAPLQASEDFWTPETCSLWPEWADSTQYPMAQVSHLMHLGHPIPKQFAVGHAFQLVYRELQTHLAELNALPSTEYLLPTRWCCPVSCIGVNVCPLLPHRSNR